MAQLPDDTPPNRVVSSAGQAEGHGQARGSGNAIVEAIGRAVGAATQSAGHAYERLVGWLAIAVLWIAQAKRPGKGGTGGTP